MFKYHNKKIFKIDGTTISIYGSNKIDMYSRKSFGQCYFRYEC